MRNIAIITVRLGSKEVHDKNIKMLGNRPLLALQMVHGGHHAFNMIM